MSHLHLEACLIIYTNIHMCKKIEHKTLTVVFEVGVNLFTGGGNSLHYPMNKHAYFISFTRFSISHCDGHFVIVLCILGLKESALMKLRS